MNKKISVLILAAVTMTASAVLAQTQAKEQFIAMTADDTNLKWSECPPGLTKGCTFAVLQGDPAQNNSDVLVKFPPKSTIEAHAHSSPEHMILLSGQMTLQYDGHPETIVKPGGFAYGPAKAPHKATCNSDVPCVLFINFDLPVDVIAGQVK